MRVVLDTNVLISAFVFPGGAPEAVYRLVLSGQCTMISSRPLLMEFARVLTAKFGWEPEWVDEAVAQLARLAEIVEPQEQVHVVAEDPDDDRVLEAAVAGHANVIVSGDRHLLKLVSWRDIPIQDPRTFMATYE